MYILIARVSVQIFCGNKYFWAIGHVNNIPTMQLTTEIARNTHSESYMLSLTECVLEFRSNALWDAH